VAAAACGGEWHPAVAPPLARPGASERLAPPPLRAVINGKVVEPGQGVDDVTVAKIEPDRVTLRHRTESCSTSS
jgi:hypothetical protein